MMNEKDIVEILKDYYEARHIRPGFPPVYEDEYHLDCAKAIMEKISEGGVETTCPKEDCKHHFTVAKCSQNHKSCCMLLYISNDYIKE